MKPSSVSGPSEVAVGACAVVIVVESTVKVAVVLPGLVAVASQVVAVLASGTTHHVGVVPVGVVVASISTVTWPLPNSGRAAFFGDSA